MNYTRKIITLLLVMAMLAGMMPQMSVRAMGTEFPEPVQAEEEVCPEETGLPEATTESVADTEPAEENVGFTEAAIHISAAADTVQNAEPGEISDFSDYTFQLYEASSGGATGPLYIRSYYMNGSWWRSYDYSNNSNDRFETRVRFEKDSSTGKYRLYYYVVHAYSKTLNVQKYYLTGVTVPAGDRTEGNSFYYGDLYGYECIDFTNSASAALLWEVTSSGYLKTQYKGSTHYLWTTTTPYGIDATYVLRLRRTTAATGKYGMPVALSYYNWFALSNAHAHIPGGKETTAVEAATCTASQKTYEAIFCTDTECRNKLASITYTSGSKDPNNHLALAERVINEQPANCQTPYTYEIEVYCEGCNLVTETKGPFQEGEPVDHVPAEAVQENVIPGNCVTPGSCESVVYCSLCSMELSRTTVDTGLGVHTEIIDQAVAPGCTESGLTEGKHCAVCNTVLVAQEVIPAGHMVENGVCTVCGVYGTCGENLTWAFEESTGTLIISGTGEMYDYSAQKNPPWDMIAASVTTVVFEEGITGVGGYAFHGCTSLEKLEFFGNAPQFAEDAFAGITATAYYPADDPTWTAEVKQQYGGTVKWRVRGGKTIRGDLNEDGFVTDADVELLLWNTLFPDLFPIEADTDFDGDGAVTDADVEYLLWHTLFPDIFPLD